MAFQDDYFYITDLQCGMDHAPKHIFDDLKAAALPLNQEQVYCVEATAGSEESTKYVSQPACKTVVIRYEAAVTVRVRLEERAGSLPVEGMRAIA